jgi:ribosome biogenesis GTPase / thiamine phosphate phosphatase
MNITELGWSPFFEESFTGLTGRDLSPARISRQDRAGYVALTEHGALAATVSGRMQHDTRSPADFPAVGDWVAVRVRPAERAATIHHLLPRRTSFSRKAPGSATDEQVLAANMDALLLVTGLDGNFKLRRIERYLTQAWESGAEPIVVLSKSDLCPDVQARIDEVERVAVGATVLAVSAAIGDGMAALQAHLAPGQTLALLGSSGVGKSTLINALLGVERQATKPVRADDDKGRHTTVRRELILHPDGGVLIDTPGLRELQLWADPGEATQAFGEIESLAADCRFRDCSHVREPGCAVQQALAEGALDIARYEAWLELQKELRHLAQKNTHKARLAGKALAKHIRQVQREKPKR